MKMIKQNIKSVAALYEELNKAYTEELYSYFEKKFIQSGGKIVLVQPFKTGKETDFYELAKKVTQYKPQAVLSIASGMDNAMLCQNLNKLNTQIPVFASLWSMTNDLITRGGKAAERIHISGVFDINSKNPSFIKFKQKYKALYNANPTFSSIYCYEAAQVLFEALKEAKDYSANEIKNSIIKIKKIQRASGRF